MQRKIVFCWGAYSGYMAACWRELARICDVHVIVWRERSESDFSESIMHCVPCTFLDGKERYNRRRIRDIVIAQEPDLVSISGWMSREYLSLLNDVDLRNTRFVLAMDTPWEGTFRQYAGLIYLRSLAKKFSACIVPGERGYQYARRLGFGTGNIFNCLYGIDYAALYACFTKRCTRPWPRQFLFTGRYEPVKNVVRMLEAYTAYRGAVDNPWPLVCCGAGSLDKKIHSTDGVENKGFVQPYAMLSEWQNAGAFILLSIYDPWPLALVEACAAGLPVIASRECGSGVEAVRDEYNGCIVDPSAESIASALIKTHDRYASLPEMGKRSLELAAPYSAEMWAKRWEGMTGEIVTSNR